MLKINDKVVCTWGSNKGKEFKIEVILKNGNYSCSSLDHDGKYYEYTVGTVRKIK